MSHRPRIDTVRAYLAERAHRARHNKRPVCPACRVLIRPQDTTLTLHGKLYHENCVRYVPSSQR